MGGSTDTGASRPTPKVGDPVTRDHAHLFRQFAVGFLPPLHTPLDWAGPRLTFTYVRAYRRGDVFSLWQSLLPGMKALRWFGVFTAPSLVVRATVTGLPPDHGGEPWGCDLHVQFVMQTATGGWDFYFSPPHERLADSIWWQRAGGLEMLAPDINQTFTDAVVAAMHAVSARHSREQDGVIDVTTTVIERHRDLFPKLPKPPKA